MNTNLLDTLAMNMSQGAQQGQAGIMYYSGETRCSRHGRLNSASQRLQIAFRWVIFMVFVLMVIPGKIFGAHTPTPDVVLIAKDATATSTREGNTLHMVANAPQRSAKIRTVVTYGSFDANYPEWSGTGVTASPGDTTASWTGIQDTTVTATLDQTGAAEDATITIHANDVRNETLSFDDTIGGTKQMLTNWMVSAGLTGTIVSAGSLNLKQELVDIYACPEVGYSKTINGSPSLTVQVGGGPTINFNILLIPLSLAYNASGSVSSTFTIANVSHDFKQPPKSRWAGSASYSATGNVALSATETWTVNTLGVQSISLSSSVRLGLIGTASYDNTTGDFKPSLGFNKTSVTITPAVTYTDGSVDNLPITIAIPGGASVSVTINLHSIIGNYTGNDPCTS